MFVEMQNRRAETVKHLISANDNFLDAGSGRVESYPGRRPPVNDSEDFMGYIVVSRKLFIYKDLLGEIVIPFSEIKKLKLRYSRIPGTSNLELHLDKSQVLFSGNTPFCIDVARSFKRGLWLGERPTKKRFTLFSRL